MLSHKKPLYSHWKTLSNDIKFMLIGAEAVKIQSILSSRPYLNECDIMEIVMSWFAWHHIKVQCLAIMTSHFWWDHFWCAWIVWCHWSMLSYNMCDKSVTSAQLDSSASLVFQLSWNTNVTYTKNGQAELSWVKPCSWAMVPAQLIQVI